MKQRYSGLLQNARQGTGPTGTGCGAESKASLVPQSPRLSWPGPLSLPHAHPALTYHPTLHTENPLVPSVTPD